MAALASVTGSSFSASASSPRLVAALAANSSSSFEFDRVARLEERVLGCPEALPERVVDVLARHPRCLPPGHQVSEGARRGAPVRGGGQRLGLGDELLLHGTRLVPPRAQLGEVLLAASGVRRPGRREAVPEVVVARLVDPGQLLPGLQQVPEAGGAAPPVVAVGQPLGVLGDAALLLFRLRRSRCPVSPASRLTLLDHRCQRVEPFHERVEVSDGLSLEDGASQLGNRHPRVVRRDRAGADPTHEKVDLDGESGETLAVERQRRLRVALWPLPDRPLAVLRPDEHGPIVVHPAVRRRWIGPAQLAGGGAVESPVAAAAGITVAGVGMGTGCAGGRSSCSLTG